MIKWQDRRHAAVPDGVPIHGREHSLDPAASAAAATQARSAPGAPHLEPLTLRLPEELEASFVQEYFRESVLHHRVVLLLGLVVFVLFGILDRWTIHDAPAELWLIRYGVVCPVLLVTLLFTFSSRFGPLAQLAMIIDILTAGIGLVLMGAVAPSPANHTFYVGLILFLISSHTLVRVRFVYVLLATWAIVGAYMAFALWLRPLPPLVALNNTFFVMAANVIGTFAGYSIERHARTDFLHRRTIEAERRRSELLLLNILPAAIAERLKSGGETIADSFPEVTVMFADIVGFTPLADRLPPGRLVTVLNSVFSAFDRVVEHYGLEKIKTMGDCYMVVGGLPVPRPDHAEAIAEAALDMQTALVQLNSRQSPILEVRIGIHTGPVVAGVIGQRKFSYDLWGDTVNTASRMESHGVPGCVQVSRATYARLCDKYVMEERGVLEVKGKGGMDTFFLTGRLPDAGARSRGRSETPD